MNIDVLDWGGAASGIPVIWIPGANGSAHVYDDIAPRMLSVGRQIGFTPRGQFPSSNPPTGYAIGDRVRDLIAILDSLKIERAVLVGHSMASDVLTEIVMDHPERIAGLVYLDGAYDRSQPIPSVPRQFASSRLDIHAPTAEGILQARCGYAPLPSQAEISETILQWSRIPKNNGPHHESADGAPTVGRSAEMTKAALGIWPGNPNGAVPRVSVAVVYARHADRDELLDGLGIRTDSAKLSTYRSWWDRTRQPALDAQRLAVARAWPEAKIIILDNASHMVMWDEPNEVEHAVAWVLAHARKN